MSKKGIVSYQPSLPGMMPEATEATKMLRSFRISEEGRDVFADRLPTKDERQIFERRLVVLDRTLAPFIDHPADDEIVEKALAAFFGGYPSLMNADADGMVKSYKWDLRTMPACAVLKGLDNIKRGIFMITDERTGRRVPLDRDWPPSSSRVYDAAVEAFSERSDEQVKLRKILRAREIVPELPPDESKVVKARIQAMHQQARRILGQPDPLEQRQRDEREQRQRAAAERSRRELEQEMIAEYEHLGIEPRRLNGIVISPELAAKLEPGVFVDKMK